MRTYRENLGADEREKTTESYFVYVAIDDEHSPVAVPDLTVDSDEGERLRGAALAGDDDLEIPSRQG